MASLSGLATGQASYLKDYLHTDVSQVLATSMTEASLFYSATVVSETQHVNM